MKEFLLLNYDGWSVTTHTETAVRWQEERQGHTSSERGGRAVVVWIFLWQL